MNTKPTVIDDDSPLAEMAETMTELVTLIDRFSEMGLDQARLINRARNKLKGKVRSLVEALKHGEEAIKELAAIKTGKEYVPSAFDASKIAESGSPYDEYERHLFEAYMRGHNWMIGYWSQDHGYEDTSTRMLWIVWRDRAALGTTDRVIMSHS